jgi:hypothetical protein
VDLRDPDPDPIVKGMDPDPDPSIIKQKIVRKTLIPVSRRNIDRVQLQMKLSLLYFLNLGARGR